MPVGQVTKPEVADRRRGKRGVLWVLLLCGLVATAWGVWRLESERRLVVGMLERGWMIRLDPVAPAWLHDLGGAVTRVYFGRVVEIQAQDSRFNLSDTIPARIEAQELQWMAQLPWLRRLNLRDSDLGDEELARLASLPRLEELDLSMTRITETSVKVLAGMTGLRRVNLEETRLSDAAFKQLTRLRPDLAIDR